MNKKAVVAVCPQCGNYPLIAKPEKQVLKDAAEDIIFYLAHGYNMIQIELTPEERAKILSCKCKD